MMFVLATIFLIIYNSLNLDIAKHLNFKLVIVLKLHTIYQQGFESPHFIISNSGQLSLLVFIFGTYLSQHQPDYSRRTLTRHS